MTHELEIGMIQKIANVALGSGKTVVHAEDFVSLVHKDIAKMGAKETTASGD